MFTKGRGNRTTQPKGSKHPAAVVVDQQVLEMRELWNTGRHTLKDLSLKYKTSISNIHVIVNRAAWQHI